MFVFLSLFGLVRGKTLLVVLSCALLLGASMMSLRQASLEKSAVREFLGKNAVMKMQVITDPNQTKPKVFGSTLAPPSYSFLATALSIGVEEETFLLSKLVEDELLLCLPDYPKHEYDCMVEGVAKEVVSAFDEIAPEKPNPFSVLAHLKKSTGES